MPPLKGIPLITRVSRHGMCFQGPRSSTHRHFQGELLTRRHCLFHGDAAIAVTKNMAQDAHLQNVHTTGRSNNTQQHAIGCE